MGYIVTIRTAGANSDFMLTGFASGFETANDQVLNRSLA